MLTPQAIAATLTTSMTTIYTVPSNTTAKVLAFIGFIQSGNLINVNVHVGAADWSLAILNGPASGSAQSVAANTDGWIFPAGTIIKADVASNGPSFVMTVLELT